eukprot:3544066-Amphidinium_carterae.1
MISAFQLAVSMVHHEDDGPRFGAYSNVSRCQITDARTKRFNAPKTSVMFGAERHSIPASTACRAPAASANHCEHSL